MFNVGGEKIAYTYLIAGGFPYTLEGTPMDKDAATEYRFVESGYAAMKGGVAIDFQTGWGIMAGVDQPPSVWEELTVTGVYWKGCKNIDECCEVLRKHDIKGILSVSPTKSMTNNATFKFSLRIERKEGYLFIANPAPYINGVSIIIVRSYPFRDE